MFEDSTTWNRFKGEKPRRILVHSGYIPPPDTDEEDRAGLRIAIVAGLVLHAGLLVLTFPEMVAAPQRIASNRPEAYVIQQVRFQPPAPQVQQQLPKPKEKRRIIPVPDPTPDEPEPIRIEQVELPDMDFDLTDADAAFGIPDAPPGLFYSGPNPYRIGNGVLPPQKVFTPSPQYTEEARQGQIQGVVILEAIIDDEGNVSAVRVLKGLPMGLAESAVDAAKQWKFKPATLDGVPVPVYFNLTVSFSLQ